MCVPHVHLNIVPYFCSKKEDPNAWIRAQLQNPSYFHYAEYEYLQFAANIINLFWFRHKNLI